MHPNASFRQSDQAALDQLVAQTGFGMVFLSTPEGPRVAHVPLLSDGKGAVLFHLARSNALTPHLDGARALVVVNGPDCYVSPRWYDDRNTVPTWDYVTLEMEGAVRKLDDDALEALLHTVIDTFENRITGERWHAEEASEGVWSGLFRGIVGFALSVEEQRSTYKLSQKKSAAERERIAAGVATAGQPALADMIRAGTS